MKNVDVIQKTDEFVMHTYRRFPVAFDKGKGAYLWDVDGRKYLDFVGGIAVNILGHNHPRVVYALTKQAGKLLHVSNLYHIAEQAQLAETLVQRSFADKVFFCNSGAEANEAAVKLARKWGYGGETPRHEIITTDRSFHGRTLGMIAASGQEKLRVGFGPDMPGFRHVPFGDEEALAGAIGPQTVAVMLEPIQGEGGVNLAPKDYLKGVKDLCQQHHLLLILDEVQVGMGRTGTLFAYEQQGIIPDIVTLAKGLGGGVPIGALLAREHVAEAFEAGSHASTFGGNPLATAAAQAVLEAIDSEEILANCQSVGSYFLVQLKALEKRYSFLHDARGLGLMLGLDSDVPARSIAEKCLERGLLVNAIGEKTLRFLPPLNISEKHVDAAIEILGEVFEELK